MVKPWVLFSLPKYLKLLVVIQVVNYLHKPKHELGVP